MYVGNQETRKPSYQDFLKTKYLAIRKPFK
jgi:hypothetical protein